MGDEAEAPPLAQGPGQFALCNHRTAVIGAAVRVRLMRAGWGLREHTLLSGWKDRPCVGPTRSTGREGTWKPGSEPLDPAPRLQPHPFLFFF